MRGVRFLRGEEDLYDSPRKTILFTVYNAVYQVQYVEEIKGNGTRLYSIIYAAVGHSK